MFQQNPATDMAKKEIIDELLKDLPTDTAIEVNLPSNNKIYRLADANAPITLRPMTFEDEKHIISAERNQDPVNLILQRCVTNININDILSLDKLYLILKLREISYGDDYHTMLVCNKCKTENTLVVKISELNINEAPESFCDPVEVDLPSINKTARVKIPRVKDESLFSTNEIYSQLWRFIKDIDGQDDKAIINAVLEKLPIRDMKIILKAMKTDFGVDTRIKFQCVECKEADVVELPIDANFFDAS